MGYQIRFDKLPAQKEFFDDDSTIDLMYSGGLGSGKTYSLCMKAIKLSYLNRGFPGGFLCPSYPDFKKDVHPMFEEIFEANKISKKVKYHRTDKTYTFPWSRKPLYIFTGERPIAGPNLAYCLINEFSLIEFERIKEMLRRVRIKKAPVKQKCMAGTPEDIHGWLEDYIERQKKLKIIRANTGENHFLDDDYRDHLQSMLDETAQRVFIGGEIVKIGGNYFYYAFTRARNVTEKAEYQEGQIIHAGVDFNVGRMAASFSHKIGDEQHFFDELMLTSSGSDTEELATAIETRFPGKKDKIVITCDASGKARKTTGRSDVEILRQRGFNVRFKAANPRLRERQLLVNGMFYNEKIKVHPRCKLLIKDWEKVQQEKSDFSKVKDKDDKLTHLSDGADYVIDWEYTLFKDRKSTQTQL